MRNEFIPYVGQYVEVTGHVVAFGRRWYRHRKYVPQLLLSELEICVNKSVYNMDHAWIEVVKYLAEANVTEYSKIKFTAQLNYYIKHNNEVKNGLQKDIGLSKIGNVKIINYGTGAAFLSYWNTILSVVGPNKTDVKYKNLIRRWETAENTCCAK